MGIRHDPQSAYVQERRKWEMRPTLIDAQWRAPQTIDRKILPGVMDGTYVEPIPFEDGGKGGQPWMPYPRMLYKAVRADGGPKVDVLNGGTLIVHSEQEEQVQRGRGWHVGQQEAMDAIHAEDREWAKLAAERNAEVRHMSEKAKAEVERHEEASFTHLPSVPETPIKRRWSAARRQAQTAKTVKE